MGETLALLSALSFGLAAVAIGQAKATARGDNGVFLSVLATLALSLVVWGTVGTAGPGDLDVRALGAFTLAGLFSVVLGRVAMYRSTEMLGAVTAGLLRRLTPLFAVPIALLLLAEVPSWGVLFGGALILAGVAIYLGAPGPLSRRGLAIGIASAASYALAFALRALGLETVPDAALGTAIGALVGLVWFPLTARGGLASLLRDRGAWHLTAAAALSAGQLLQFFALGHATVATVAMLGALDVLFAALLLRLMGVPAPLGRLGVATALAAIGTVMVIA